MLSRPFKPANHTALLSETVSVTPRQEAIIKSAFDALVFLMVSTNSCQNPSDYQEYLGNEFNSLPLIKASSCSQLDLPNVDSLPGFFSVTAAQYFFYPSIQHNSGQIVNGTFLEKNIQDPIPLQPVPARQNNIGGRVERLWNFGFSDPCIVDNKIYTESVSNISDVPGGLVTIGGTTSPKQCLCGFNSNWQQALNNTMGSPLSNIITTHYSDETCYKSGSYTSMTCDHAWWLSNIFNGGNAST
ncbi:hypothetical protein N7495_004863 [Penicillium taxi]|uniref:uncharacterized protein n=1 Tax=Penicillium taxi TaxID=168475 RepID=UPI002545171F|nr:uncharacterized protein N7495_004863 [Penicillium taxi]KAJ5900119.1 hypothetical protein N7495_004863 [Penicillium taxi]